VLLLADVLEKFRKTCFETYHLDLAHYYSSSGLAWDAMLKMTGIELELVDDRELHDIIDKGIRYFAIKFVYYCLEWLVLAVLVIGLNVFSEAVFAT
jgi:hypothetical protein